MHIGAFKFSGSRPPAPVFALGSQRGSELAGFGIDMVLLMRLDGLRMGDWSGLLRLYEYWRICGMDDPPARSRLKSR
jgi:hypothetical protein